MSKNWKIAAVVAVVATVAVTALLDAGFVAAQTPHPRQGFGPWHGAGGHRHGGMFGGFMRGDHEAMQETMANALGISIDKLEAAQAEGKRLPELAEELGLGIDKVHATMEATRSQALEDAVADGSITQAHADEMTARHAKIVKKIAAAEWVTQSGPRGHRGGFDSSPGDCPKYSE
jgi:hypothetical protein